MTELCADPAGPEKERFTVVARLPGFADGPADGLKRCQLDPDDPNVVVVERLADIGANRILELVRGIPCVVTGWLEKDRLAPVGVTGT